MAWGQGDRGWFKPCQDGQAGQGSCGNANIVRQEWLAGHAPVHQNLPFSSHACLFPFQRVIPLPGLQTCHLRDAAALPTPKHSWGCPELGSSLPVLPGASLLWKRDLAKGLWHGKIPLASFGAEHPRLCTSGETMTEILYLRHRGDSTALALRTRSPLGAVSDVPGHNAL